jgi:hypothetical protein
MAQPLALPIPRAEWADLAWWDDLIGTAIRTADPALCNLRITLAHYELSLALHAVLGADSGANFHTWAVWGSKKAGTTIRQEDVPYLRPLAALLGGALGGLIGLIGALALAPAVGPLTWLVAAGAAALGGGGLYAWVRRALDAASRAILGGNITVLDDIGHATARYVVAFLGHPGPDPARLTAFLDSLRPGPATHGGQDLLREAFTHYDRARLAPDLDGQHEQMLLANLKAILHEHLRLQPYIVGSMPRLTRRLITARLLHYQLGVARLNVYQDVPAADAGAPAGFPATLTRLDNPDLLRFLDGQDGWDRTPDSLIGSRATDWTDIRDRMNYICDLFRAHHCAPGLFVPPYTDRQIADVDAGHLPPPPL